MESRLIPYSIAGIVCFAAAFFLGAGFWYFFGTGARALSRNGNTTVQTSNQNIAENNSNAENFNAGANENVAPPTPAPIIKKAPAGEIPVSGGEVTLGGEVMLGGEEVMKLPLRRVSVADFAVGETEVTNAQYAEFVAATGRRAPTNWKDGKFSEGAADEPVTGVTWADASDYCRWLSEQIGATVRLPSEAEWERAARGDTDYQYPWGGEWNDEAAPSIETKGKVRPAKSLPAGRSPFGAYEMVGNVWEWTDDLAVNESGEPVLYEKSKRRIIKGGAASEPRKNLVIDAAAARPEDMPSNLLGFRYVVVRQ